MDVFSTYRIRPPLSVLLALAAFMHRCYTDHLPQRPESIPWIDPQSERVVRPAESNTGKIQDDVSPKEEIDVPKYGSKEVDARCVKLSPATIKKHGKVITGYPYAGCPELENCRLVAQCQCCENKTSSIGTNTNTMKEEKSHLTKPDRLPEHTCNDSWSQPPLNITHGYFTCVRDKLTCGPEYVFPI